MTGHLGTSYKADIHLNEKGEDRRFRLSPGKSSPGPLGPGGSYHKRLQEREGKTATSGQGPHTKERKKLHGRRIPCDSDSAPESGIKLPSINLR